VVTIRKPCTRVVYSLEERTQPDLTTILGEFLKKKGKARARRRRS
jgi:hypothetical protein